MLKRFQCVAFVGLLLGFMQTESLMAAQEAQADPLSVLTPAARAALEQVLPQLDQVQVKAEVLPGYFEVRLGSDILYLSADGQYLIQGRVLDLKSRVDLVEASLTEVRKDLLDHADKLQMISFVPEHPAYSVYVFTDLDCTYCRRLHAQMAEYNDLGIAVHYLFYPRGGLGSASFTNAESVWCAADRANALTQALLGQTPPAAECENPVRQQFELGNQAGVAKIGTPTIMLENGTVVRGYMPPSDLYAHLQRNLGPAGLPATP